MPWQEMSPVDLRIEFVHAFQTGLWSMTELCDQYQISRKTGYKWVDRYEADGRAGLRDRSRRPHHSPRASDPAIVDALCAARRMHPTWSARKLLAVLRRRQPTIAWPQRSDRGGVAQGARPGPRPTAAIAPARAERAARRGRAPQSGLDDRFQRRVSRRHGSVLLSLHVAGCVQPLCAALRDRKSTRLNSSHV